jgi:hypothetical protein
MHACMRVLQAVATTTTSPIAHRHHRNKLVASTNSTSNPVRARGRLTAATLRMCRRRRRSPTIHQDQERTTRNGVPRKRPVTHA